LFVGAHGSANSARPEAGHLKRSSPTFRTGTTCPHSPNGQRATSGRPRPRWREVRARPTRRATRRIRR
jgi:hypothetical protein